MKTIEQLSIFLENQTGRLGEITHMLADANVSIRTLELVEAGDFGILRLIVADPASVKEHLSTQGISARVTPVIAIEIADEVGCFNRVVSALSDEGIDIAYTYTVHNGTRGAFVIKVAATEIAAAVARLEADGVKVLEAV
jgi:hypothetical protein